MKTELGHNKNNMNKRINTLLGLIGFSMIPLISSANAEQLTIERIMQAPSLSGQSPVGLKVSPDGQRVTFLKGKVDDYERYDLWEYHIASGKTQMLFDSNDLHTGDEVLSDEEKARRERMRVYGTGIMSYHWSHDGKALIFPLAGDVYYYKLGDKSAKQLLDTPEFETDVKFSPKSNYVSYIREQNLYVMDIASGKEKAITTKGGGDIKYGMSEFVAQEEMSRMTGYWWSPDERHIAFTKVDESPVEVITRSEIYADSIKTIEQKYPKAGTDNVHIELAISGIDNDTLKWINLGDNKDIYLARAQWMNDEALSFQTQSRNQQLLTLSAYNIATNEQNTLIKETSETWLNLHDDLRFLNDKSHFVWASERDGFKHLYLYKNNGDLVKQLTSGDWIVESVKAIDAKARMIYFQGRKDTPLESHLYSLNIDTAETNRLTDLGKYHSTTFAADASIFINAHSDANSPTQVSLHKANGEQITWLEENKVDKSHPLYAYQKDWVKPTFGIIKANDGSDLHYRLYTPKKIEGKHPAIVYLYGGPIAQVVTNRWGGSRGLLMQHWVNKGYVVFSIDNRGSANRGKAFEDPLYKKMGFVEVEDQVTGVEFLRTLDFVDSKRVGVHGHSYGGYMTLMTMFKASEHFAAGVSGAPVTDWRLYDTHYTERYMGDPRNEEQAYTASSVFPYAKDLKGDLLIYHGMADDNVLFTHSTKLYKHLQDLAIPFEVMDYPGKKHSIRGKNTRIHMYRTITNFFDKHLMATH
ncbi:dipeptidyl peptidase IV [Glaciecola sp. KUL10]|nr:dipeptidyl peptidase IV [Glaciecola sp. KUL10]